MNKSITNISNSWIIGCSLLTGGIITSSYLHGINELQLFHMKFKYKKEMDLIQNNNNNNNNDNEFITYYSRHYTIAFILGITGISYVAFKSIQANK